MYVQPVSSVHCTVYQFNAAFATSSGSKFMPHQSNQSNVINRHVTQQQQTAGVAPRMAWAAVGAAYFDAMGDSSDVVTRICCV